MTPGIALDQHSAMTRFTGVEDVTEIGSMTSESTVDQDRELTEGYGGG